MALACFGDGASNQGVFHESLNMAAIWRLPVAFVCETIYYAMSSLSRLMVAGRGIAERAAGYDIPGMAIDGNDVLAVRNTVWQIADLVIHATT